MAGYIGYIPFCTKEGIDHVEVDTNAGRGLLYFRRSSKLMTKFSVNPTGLPWTRAMGNLETDLFRAAVHIQRNGEGGIERPSQLAEREGWAVSKARRVLAAGEACGRFYIDYGVGVWKWTPEFANA